MTYCGIDVGKNWGWGIYNPEMGILHGSEKFQTLVHFEERIRHLIMGLDVNAVVTCRAMGRNQQVIRFHSAMAAIVEYFCEKHGISYFDVADGSMRKVVIGKGNAKKPEVMAFLKIENEHAADAMCGAKYLAAITI